MPDTTVKLELKNLVQGQEDSVAHLNENLHKLDAIICLSVLDRALNTPPLAAEGDAYLVGDSPTGEWADYANYVAYYFGAQWNYLEPKKGMVAWVEDEQVMCRFTGSAWESRTGESIYQGRKTSAQTISGSGTDITWNSDVRKDGIYTHSTSSNQDQIVVGEAGDYEVTAEITLDYSSGTGFQRVQLEITLDASSVAGSLARGAVDSNVDQLTVTFSRVVSCDAGDVIRIRGTHSAGGGVVQAMANGCRVRVRRV